MFKIKNKEIDVAAEIGVKVKTVGECRSFQGRMVL
jgi:hypothetical protein